MPAAKDADGQGVAPAADVVVSFVERLMLPAARSIGWGTSLYGPTEEEIGIVGDSFFNKNVTIVAGRVYQMEGPGRSSTGRECRKSRSLQRLRLFYGIFMPSYRMDGTRRCIMGMLAGTPLELLLVTTKNRPQ